MADAVHQAQAGQTPDITPTLWHSFPMDACGQLQELCHDGTTTGATACHTLGHAGSEPACLGQLTTCLAACAGGEHAHSGSPCSGLCSNPQSISVPDGTTYAADLGSTAACIETTSELLSGTCTPASRDVIVNGRTMKCNKKDWDVPLPTQRNHGYCIQSDSGPPNHLDLTLR